jgi:hypothetical protein
MTAPFLDTEAERPGERFCYMSRGMGHGCETRDPWVFAVPAIASDMDG